MTAKKAAEFLGVSERTLWTMTARRDLPVYRVGRLKRYRLKDLEAFLSARRE